MTVERFPAIDLDAARTTRNALHAYAQILGDCLKATRPRRKHWWHASLRPSLAGLSTGVVRAGTDFELELDLIAGELRVCTAEKVVTEVLTGQSAASLASWLDETLAAIGVDASLGPDDKQRIDQSFPGYSAAQAAILQGAFASVAAALEEFRAGIREETSPIQIWPHHFDLAMLWLPGDLVEGEDPSDAERADEQMNFGFVLGDEAIPEPYVYVTAYPMRDGLRALELPEGASWWTEGFQGAVLPYAALSQHDDPDAHLDRFLGGALTAGRGREA